MSFLVLLLNIDCRYSLQPPLRGGSNVYPQSMFTAKIRKILKKKSSENEHFYSCEILLFIAWACLRNGLHRSGIQIILRSFKEAE